MATELSPQLPLAMQLVCLVAKVGRSGGASRSWTFSSEQSRSAGKANSVNLPPTLPPSRILHAHMRF